ncbi:ras association domain-containing protein 10-like [Uloborus diversus]|uniref:ras association domain-containing protein 10-like n=1 Tax=Uloborus diversus TaxID=327109 RepID=UPI002409E1DC|nr:ras association domain-containing protein 10-like [Uloborus diversus]
MEAVIPFWVEGKLVWITGLTHKTTFREVISSIIKYQYEREASPEEVQTFKVVERWEWMERHLRSRCKILQVWQSWGEERKNVYFVLRKRSSNELSRKSKKAKMLRSKHGNRNQWKVKFRSEYHALDEEILKGILLSQQKVLLRQKDELKSKELEIEEYETSTHFSRMKVDGENYLQDMYLGEKFFPEGSSSFQELKNHHVTKEAICEIEMLYENILDLSKRIEKQEYIIRLLSAQIRYSLSLKENRNDSVEEETLTFVGQKNSDIFMCSQKTKVQVDCISELNKSQKFIIDRNERLLKEYDKILELKQNCIEQLQEELDKANLEIGTLQQSSNGYIKSSTSRKQKKSCRYEAVLNDYSSDTGLSSLASSSEENNYTFKEERGYVLDTLV